MKTLEQIIRVQPANLADALDWLQRAGPGDHVLAGGTDLLVQWQSEVRPMPERVLDITGLDELRGIRRDEDQLLIGAAETHDAISRHHDVRSALPALAAACATVGARQIQCLGTLGGNVVNASPAGDTLPALLITGGHLLTASTTGKRRIPLERFFLDYRKIDLQPNELIVRFELPACPPDQREYFRKLGTRGAQAISKVVAACRASCQDGRLTSLRLALGSVAPTCIRLHQLEQWIAGKTLDPDLIAEAEQRAADEVRPIADIRSTAPYRKWVSGRLVRGFLENMAQ